MKCERAQNRKEEFPSTEPGFTFFSEGTEHSIKQVKRLMNNVEPERQQRPGAGTNTCVVRKALKDEGTSLSSSLRELSACQVL